MDANDGYVDSEKKVANALRSQRVRYATNKRRRNFSEKEKLREEQEAKRRQEILARRRQDLKEATEKFQHNKLAFQRAQEVNAINEARFQQDSNRTQQYRITVEDALKAAGCDQQFTTNLQTSPATHAPSAENSTVGKQVHQHGRLVKTASPASYKDQFHTRESTISAHTISPQEVRESEYNQHAFSQQLAKHQAMLKLQHERALQHFNEAIKREIEQDGPVPVTDGKQHGNMHSDSNEDVTVQYTFDASTRHLFVSPPSVFNVQAEKAQPAPVTEKAKQSVPKFDSSQASLLAGVHANGAANAKKQNPVHTPFETLGTSAHLKRDEHRFHDASIHAGLSFSNVAIVQPQVQLEDGAARRQQMQLGATPSATSIIAPAPAPAPVFPSRRVTAKDVMNSLSDHESLHGQRITQEGVKQAQNVVCYRGADVEARSNGSAVQLGRGGDAWSHQVNDMHSNGAAKQPFKLHSAAADTDLVQFAANQPGSDTCNAFMNRMATAHKNEINRFAASAMSPYVLPSSPATVCQVNFTPSSQAAPSSVSKQQAPPRVDDLMELTVDDAEDEYADFDQPSHETLHIPTTSAKSILKKPLSANQVKRAVKTSQVTDRCQSAGIADSLDVARDKLELDREENKKTVRFNKVISESKGTVPGRMHAFQTSPTEYVERRMELPAQISAANRNGSTSEQSAKKTSVTVSPAVNQRKGLEMNETKTAKSPLQLLKSASQMVDQGTSKAPERNAARNAGVESQPQYSKNIKSFSVQSNGNVDVQSKNGIKTGGEIQKNGERRVETSEKSVVMPHKQAANTKETLKNTLVNSFALSKTPTDEEINGLWEAVRAYLQQARDDVTSHKEQASQLFPQGSHVFSRVSPAFKNASISGRQSAVSSEPVVDELHAASELQPTVDFSDSDRTKSLTAINNRDGYASRKSGGQGYAASSPSSAHTQFQSPSHNSEKVASAKVISTEKRDGTLNKTRMIPTAEKPPRHPSAGTVSNKMASTTQPHLQQFDRGHAHASATSYLAKAKRAKSALTKVTSATLSEHCKKVTMLRQQAALPLPSQVPPFASAPSTTRQRRLSDSDQVTDSMALFLLAESLSKRSISESDLEKAVSDADYNVPRATATNRVPVATRTVRNRGEPSTLSMEEQRLRQSIARLDNKLHMLGGNLS